MTQMCSALVVALTPSRYESQLQAPAPVGVVGGGGGRGGGGELGGAGGDGGKDVAVNGVAVRLAAADENAELPAAVQAAEPGRQPTISMVNDAATLTTDAMLDEVPAAVLASATASSKGLPACPSAAGTSVAAETAASATSASAKTMVTRVAAVASSRRLEAQQNVAEHVASGH